LKEKEKEKAEAEIDHPLAERKEDRPTTAIKASGKFGEMLVEAGRGWYDFNDSTVKSIPVERLATQYAGRSECACTHDLFSVFEIRFPLNTAHRSPFQTC
jgi:hypothetical protein